MSPLRPSTRQAEPVNDMEIKRGIPVSPGVAIGPALVRDTEWFRIPQRFVDRDSLAQEVERLHFALAEAARQARANQKEIAAKLGSQYGAVFGAHAQLIEDPALAGEMESLIRKQGHAAEYAV